MDPDMVRQQEEEEIASRLRGPMKVKMPASRPAFREQPIILRAEPPQRQQSLPPSPSALLGMTPWTAAQTAIAGSVMTAIGLFGGIMLGVKTGLIPEQRLAIGAGAGFLLGWQSLVLSSRRSVKATVGRSMIACLMPAALILGTSIAGMIAAAHLTGIAEPASAKDYSMQYWLIAGASMMAGTIFAGVRLYKTFTR